MMFAGPTFASSALASETWLATAAPNVESGAPINVIVNAVSRRAEILDESLSIDDTLGEQVVCRFTMVNPGPVPVVGDQITVTYFSQVLFAGTIDRIERHANQTLTQQLYACVCADWTQILFRRKIRRSFTDTTIQNVLESMLDNELLGEPLTIGTIDTQATIHLVDAKNARTFDVCRDIASAAGQTFYVDFDQSLQVRSSSNPPAPLVFSTSTVLAETVTTSTDRETYRNVQTVLVTGHPATDQDTALTTTEQVRNEDQIAERAAIEGGTGIYEEIVEIVHPTSNLPIDLTILGQAFANIQLLIAGIPRVTVRCRARGYGFRAGQIATVTLPTIGVQGSFVVQRVSIQEVAGRYLFHDLELTSSSAQQRAYESWLKIITGGSKVTVQIPGALTHNSQLFSTPGASAFVVPAGVTVVTITCKGGSAGGGGGNIHFINDECDTVGYEGGRGGNSGKALSSVNVLEGQTIDVTVGAKGVKGTGGQSGSAVCLAIGVSTDGTNGTASTAFRSGISLAEGYGGIKGLRGTTSVGSAGAHGGGSGSQVIVGGGKIGGAGGTAEGSAGQNGVDGMDGDILIEW